MKSHDSNLFKCLNDHANQLYERSVIYSRKRIVAGKYIHEIPAVKNKLYHAKAILTIFQCLLENNINESVLHVFVKSSVEKSLEDLLFIHGANGYSQSSSAAESWLSCRKDILKITERAPNDNI